MFNVDHKTWCSQRCSTNQANIKFAEARTVSSGQSKLCEAKNFNIYNLIEAKIVNIYNLIDIGLNGRS